MGKIKLKEGDIFEFSVSNISIRGLITRVGIDNIPLGYFFVNSSNLNFETDRPILIKQFGFQGFKDKTWKIIENYKKFSKSNFPIPKFVHQTNPYPAELISYNDDLIEIKREKIPNENLEEYSLYPRAGLGGSGFIEKVILKNLNE
jgi:hypothetical protein